MDLDFNFKKIRANVIAHHFTQCGFKSRKVVVLTCGNAATALREAGLNVTEVGSGPNAELAPRQWLTPADVARLFPYHFDATSGHLPFHMMLEVAKILRHVQPGTEMLTAGPDGEEIIVPSGSGESAVITALAFPQARVVARFDASNPPTVHEPQNLLYWAFEAFAIRVELAGSIWPT